MALLARISTWFHGDPYDALCSAIAPARQRLVEHALYDRVNTLPRLRQFMRVHVFPVWDFMCLAKRLQHDHGDVELYIEAMEEVGARTSAITRFLEMLDGGMTSDTAMNIAYVPREARAFVRRTHETVTTGTTVEVLAAFVFGREDLEPMLSRWGASRTATRFTDFVQRYAAASTGEDQARRALIAAAGNDPAAWSMARESAERAIAARVALWDTVNASMT